jgi:WD40 repeat protein
MELQRMNLAQRIVEGNEQPRDAYELAGCARSEERREDVTAGLARLAAENAGYIAHWNQETRRKGQQLQRQIESAQATFSSAEQRQRYDDSLVKSIRQAYRSELAGQTGEALKRWLRLAQNVHSSRIETLARNLLDEKSGAAPVAVAPTPKVAEPQQVEPKPAAVAAAPTQTTKIAKSRPARRPPARPGQPDYFALPWIVGSAAVTAVICLALLLYFFRDRFGGEAVARVPAGETVTQEPTETEPLTTEFNPPPEVAPIEPPSKGTNPSPNTSPGPIPTPPSPPTTIDPNAPPGANTQPQPTPPGPTTNPMPEPPATPMPMPATTTQPAASSGGARQTIEFGRAVHSVAWDSSGKLLALAGDGGDVLIWDTATNVESRRLQDSFPAATCVAFNSRSVGVTTSDNRVIVWNAFSGKLERTLRHADLNDPRTLAWLPNTGDGQVLIGDGAGAIRTFSLASSNPVAAIELAADAGAVQAVALSSNRPVAISAHLDGSVVQWNLGGKVAQKCLMPSNSSLVKALQQTAAANSKGAEISYCSHEVCYDVDFSPDELLLATAAIDLELWELESARHLIRRRVLPGVPGAKAYRVVDFSADGSLLATGNAEGSLAIIDVATWSVVAQEKLAGPILCLAWHPSDGRKLAVGQENGQTLVMPLAKNINSFKATPDFDGEKLLEMCKTLVEDEEWFDASRLLAVLSAYQLPVTARTEIDRMRGLARKGVQELVDEADPKSNDPDELDDGLVNLQLAMDIDPLGKLGKDARAKIKLFPARTPQALMKAAAAEAVDTKAKSPQNPNQRKLPRRP